MRHIVTTDSFDLPSPGVLAPSEVRANPLYSATSASQTILDLLLLRNPALTSAQIAQLLPNEVIAGLRMDINRPFGNGRDDNNNGVVDDPAEATGELVWPALPTTATAPAVPTSLANFSNAKFDADNDGIPNSATDMYARQVYARHLYVLMTLLLDQNVIANKIDWNNDGDITTDLYETQRGIAQWAINVADFQDRDSIMTPFPYMIDPFHGWTVSNVPQLPSAYVAGATDIVWGCERPELLITETLAFHDRRTEDRNDESFDNSDPSTPSAAGQGFTYDIPLTMKDGDFDQRLMPLGSFFVELYNPWTTHSSTLNPDGSSNATGNPSVPDAPGEFYDVATAIK